MGVVLHQPQTPEKGGQGGPVSEPGMWARNRNRFSETQLLGFTELAPHLCPESGPRIRTEKRCHGTWHTGGPLVLSDQATGSGNALNHHTKSYKVQKREIGDIRKVLENDLVLNVATWMRTGPRFCISGWRHPKRLVLVQGASTSSPHRLPRVLTTQ